MDNNRYNIIGTHSEKCLNIGKVTIDNIKNVNKEIINYDIYKEKLYKEPLINYHNFKKYASELYRQNDYNFNITINTIKNIFYKFRNMQINIYMKKTEKNV